MLNRKLSLGWGSWALMIEERRHCLQLLRHGLSFFVAWQLGTGFRRFLFSELYTTHSHMHMARSGWYVT